MNKKNCSKIKLSVKLTYHSRWKHVLIIQLKKKSLSFNLKISKKQKDSLTNIIIINGIKYLLWLLYFCWIYVLHNALSVLYV